MKHIKKISLLFIFLALGAYIYSQKECKVLLPNISGTYEGKCKRGLAHGKGKAVGIDTYEGKFRKGLPNGYGVYTNSTGEVFKGHWRKGMKHGKGEFIFNEAYKDSVITGIWKKDIYIGPIPVKPRVLHIEHVDRYTFKRTGEGKRVFIDIFLNGMRNTDIEQFRVLGTSGFKTHDGHIVYFEDVHFPFTCKIDYITWNKAHTSQHSVTFEFEISQAGTWKLSIYN